MEKGGGGEREEREEKRRNGISLRKNDRQRSKGEESKLREKLNKPVKAEIGT